MSSSRNEFPVQLTRHASIESSVAEGSRATVGRNAALVAVVMNVTATTDAIETFDILKNGVDTGVDLKLPVTSADAGAVCYPRKNTPVAFTKFDNISLKSHADSTTVCSADMTAIFRI